MPLISPSTDNYFVGKGVLLFQPDGQSYYHFLGNVTEMELTPTVETLDHFSSQSGIRSKDKTVVIEKSGTVRIVMEELTARNLSLFLLGDVDMTDPDHPEIEIFSETEKGGALIYRGTNEIGPRWEFDFARVEFVPSSSMNPISDEWGNIEVTGNLAEVDGTFGTATWTNLNDEGVPINIELPSFTGTLEAGETLTAANGTWLNYGDTPTSFAYQWKRDGVNIGAATASTYVLVDPDDVGAIITVQVTATNENGNAVAVSEPGTVEVIS